MPLVSSFSTDLNAPAERIFHLTVLNAGNGIENSVGNRADFAAVNRHKLSFVVKLADGGNDGSRTGTERFIQLSGIIGGSNFINRELTLGDLIAPMLEKVDGGITGNAR